MLIEILGLLFCIIVGTIGHFLYKFSNKNKVVGYFFSTNESLWQHIKLGITPIVLWTIVEFLTFNYKYLFIVKFISIFIFIIVLLSLYYLYKFIFKKNILFLDILIFYISLSISFIISIKLLYCNCFSLFLNILGFIGIIFILYSYKFLNLYSFTVST